jgi:hypothetical protein
MCAVVNKTNVRTSNQELTDGFKLSTDIDQRTEQQYLRLVRVSPMDAVKLAAAVSQWH